MKIMCLIWGLIITGCVSTENSIQTVAYDDSWLALEKAIELGLRKVKEEYRFTQAYNLTASLSDRCCFVSIYFLPRSPGNDLMVNIYDDGTVTITPSM